MRGFPERSAAATYEGGVPGGMGSKGMPQCKACQSERPAAAFTPSSIRSGRLRCKSCHYRAYVQPKREQAGALGRLARALEQRERRKGVARAGKLTASAVLRILQRAGFLCACTGHQLPAEALALCRADETRPFDAEGNCMVVSRSTLARRRRM